MAYRKNITALIVGLFVCAVAVATMRSWFDAAFLALAILLGMAVSPVYDYIAKRRRKQ